VKTFTKDNPLNRNAGSIYPWKIGLQGNIPKFSTKKVITSPNVAKAIAPYSQAISSNGFLFVSGQLGLDPKTGNLVANGIEAQTKRAMENIGEILKEGETSFDNVVKTTILLRDMKDYSAVNEIYSKYFKKDPPARVCYSVLGLPKDALIEIEVTASL